MVSEANHEKSTFRFRDGKFLFADTCMGTGFIVQGHSLFDEGKTLVACQRAFEILHEADRTFSLYKPESPLSKLARGATTLADCPPVVAEIWDDCERWERTTDGWFCAFTPQNTFDPSGLVKTWAAERACEYLKAEGILDFSFNAGGDVYLSDELSEPEGWRVGVHKPVSLLSEDAGTLTVVDLRNTPYRAVCTSGSAERGEHIWNPKGYPLDRDALVQITVVSKNLVEADVWATAGFARGGSITSQLDELNHSNPENQVHALGVLKSGSLVATKGIEGLLAKTAS